MGKRALSMNRTLAWMLMVGYTALLVLLLVISLYWISNTQYEVERAEDEALAGYVDRASDEMSMLERHIYDTYATNRDFLALSGLQSYTENYETAYYLREAMTSKMFLENYIHGFAIFYDNLSNVWYRTKDNVYLTNDEMRQAVEAIRPGVLSIVRQRTWERLNIGGEPVMVVTCRRDNAAISGMYCLKDAGDIGSGLRRPGQVAILTDVGEALRGAELADALGLAQRLPADGGLFSQRLGGYRVHARRIPQANLWIVLAVKIDLWSLLNAWQLGLLLLTAASVVAVILLYSFFRREFLRPTRELTQAMEQLRQGEISEVPTLDVRFTEMREVNRTLARMVSEIESQKVKIYEEIIEKQKAQMQYLQLQLRPHFYLNGLKTINALAINGDTEAIQSMVYAVSDHLRFLFRESQLVRLSEELDFTENYVALQRQTAARDIRLEVDADPAVREWLVPILCVQTFVENSVKYARTAVSGAPLAMEVRVDMLATEEGRYIDLIISDNCQGYSDDVLERVNSGNFGDDGRAVGIGNILRRCRLLYGERAELRFYNEGGAVSELILPELSEDEGEARQGEART